MFEKIYYVVYVVRNIDYNTRLDNQRWAIGTRGYDDAIGRYETKREAERVTAILQRTAVCRLGIVCLVIRRMTISQMVTDYCKNYDQSYGQAGYQYLSQMAQRLFKKCQNNLFYPECMINVEDQTDDSIAPQETDQLEEYLGL